MAGGGPSTPTSSRKKSLDAEINLVPFIDLLSVCICFLLMTAVWIQIASLQVKQSHGTEAAAAATDTVDMELKFISVDQLKVDFKKNGRMVKTFAVKSDDKKLLLTQLDTQLGSVGLKIATGMVTPKTGVSYGDLVGVMDVLRKNKIMNLGIVPVKQ